MFFWIFNKLVKLFQFTCNSVNEEDIFDRYSENTIENLSEIVNVPEKKNECYYIDYDEISDITWEDSE